MTALFPAHDEERFTLTRIDGNASSLAEDVRRGLGGRPKSLPPRWFYDALGSSLFDAICNLPEYYVTRAETEVLTAHREEIAASFGGATRIVELGSGSARKTRILLDALHDGLVYAPVDIDAGVLETSARELL